jgi:hypothetical protein
MSTILTSKLKYPESINKGNEYLLVEAKEQPSMIKQIKNIKLSKYSKYFGNNIHNIELAVLKIKENKKSLIIPRGKNEFKSRNENTSQKSSEKLPIQYDENSTSQNHRLIQIKNESNPNRLNPFNKKSKCDSLDYGKIQNFMSDNFLDIITEREISIVETQRGSTANNSIHNPKSNLIYKEINLNFSECESHIRENPQYCVEYFPEIYKNFKAEERALKKIKDYMKFQNDLNEKMRAILVDWMIDVHLKFKLTTETLFLSVYLVDVYLSNKVIQRNQLQLVGVACLLITNK